MRNDSVGPVCIRLQQDIVERTRNSFFLQMSKQGDIVGRISGSLFEKDRNLIQAKQAAYLKTCPDFQLIAELLRLLFL
jgi:hypothetical protein